MSTNPLPFLAASIYTNYKHDFMFKHRVDSKPGCKFHNMVAHSSLAPNNDPGSKEFARLVDIVKFLFKS